MKMPASVCSAYDCPHEARGTGGNAAEDCGLLQLTRLKIWHGEGKGEGRCGAGSDRLVV